MARPLWTGTISFGLVTIPVGLYSAVASREDRAFHLLHVKDGSRIDYKRFCAKEDVEVPWREIARGYEYAKGRYVTLTEEELAGVRVEATHTFAIRAFVPARDVDGRYFDHPYYLAPGTGGARAYGLLREALERSGRLGIGTIVLRQREHLAALEPAGEALALTTMRFAHELRPPQSSSARRDRHSKPEVALAVRLVEAMAAAWRPADYRDTYADALREVIGRKVRGEPPETPAKPRRPAPVTDLRAALERSLAEPRRRARGAAGRGRRKGRQAA